MIAIILALIFAGLLALWFLGNLVWMCRRWSYCPACGRYWNELGETSEFQPPRMNGKTALCPNCAEHFSDPAAPNYMQPCQASGETRGTESSEAQTTTDPARNSFTDAGTI